MKTIISFLVLVVLNVVESSILVAQSARSAAQEAMETLRRDAAQGTTTTDAQLLDAAIDDASHHVSDEPRPKLSNDWFSGWLSWRVKNYYVSRAFVLSDESRTDALLGLVINDPAKTVFDSYSLILYGNASLADDPQHLAGEEGFNEIDYSFEVAKDLHPVTVTLGWQEFFLPLSKHEGFSNLDQHKFWIQELYAIVTLDTLLSPTAKVYYDLGDGGVYTELGISHCFELGEKWCVTAGATVGASWGDYYTLPDGISDASVTLGFTYQVNENLTLELQGGIRAFTHPFPGDDDVYPLLQVGMTLTF